MQPPPEAKRQRPRWAPPLLVGLAGLALMWVMWVAGGDFWPLQRPFMAVTLLSCATFVVAAVSVSALPRGAWRLLMLALAGIAALATFFGEDLAERGRFDGLRASLAADVANVARGGDCATPCRIQSRAPLRVAFLLSGDDRHWSGACYDATDMIYGAEYAGRVRPLDTREAAMLAEARAMFDGEVRHAPSWGDHWYGCSTRP